MMQENFEIGLNLQSLSRKAHFIPMIFAEESELADNRGCKVYRFRHYPPCVLFDKRVA